MPARDRQHITGENGEQSRQHAPHNSRTAVYVHVHGPTRREVIADRQTVITVVRHCRFLVSPFWQSRNVSDRIFFATTAGCAMQNSAAILHIRGHRRCVTAANDEISTALGLGRPTKSDFKFTKPSSRRDFGFGPENLVSQSLLVLLSTSGASKRSSIDHRVP